MGFCGMHLLKDNFKKVHRGTRNIGTFKYFLKNHNFFLYLNTYWFDKIYIICHVISTKYNMYKSNFIILEKIP